MTKRLLSVIVLSDVGDSISVNSVYRLDQDSNDIDFTPKRDLLTDCYLFLLLKNFNLFVKLKICLVK